MKKTLLISAIVLALTVPSFAGLDLNVWGGYTMVSMAAPNKQLNDFAELFPILPPGVELTKVIFGNAFIAGIDAGFAPIKGLSIGLRGEYIGGMSASVLLEDAASGDFMKMYMDATLIPVLAGATYKLSLNDSISMGGGLYFGYGIAGATVGMEQGLPVLTEKVGLEGGGFAMDVNADVAFKIAEVMNIGLKIGYRIANIAEMKAAEDNSDMGIVKGDVFEDSDDVTIPFDYSGLVAGATIGFSF